MLSAKRMLSATYLPGGLCAVEISLFVCSYTVYVVYINMRLTVTWSPMGIGPQPLLYLQGLEDRGLKRRDKGKQQAWGSAGRSSLEIYLALLAVRNFCITTKQTNTLQ